MRIGCLLIGFFSVLNVASAANASDGVRVDGVAAYVNAHVITYSDVMAVSRPLQMQVAQGNGGEAVNALYQEALQDIIERKLILDAYEDQTLIQIPDTMVEERVQNVVSDMFKNDRMAFLSALSADGNSEAAWRAQIREQMIVGAMRNLNVNSRVQVSPLAVRERYERTIGQHMRPPMVKFRMIVISIGQDGASRTEQHQKLSAARAALADGEGFAEVAKRFSEGALAQEGGLRDWVDPDMLRSELRDLVMNAPIGAVSDPIEMGSHYALIKVEDRQEASSLSFDDAYADIERELRLEMAKQLYEEWIEQLRADSFVRVLDEAPY